LEFHLLDEVGDDIDGGGFDFGRHSSWIVIAAADTCPLPLAPCGQAEMVELFFRILPGGAVGDSLRCPVEHLAAHC
jgi:hypothetical protein